LWPTPTTQEIEHDGMRVTHTGRRLTKDGKNSHSMNLADSVKFPTPMASDWKNKNYSRDYTLGNSKYLWPTPRASNPGSRPNGKGGKILAEEVKKSMFPTPGTTGLSNGSGNCGKINELYEQGVISDEERRSMRSGNGGQLSADWVELLMGYPLGFTDIDKNDVSFDNHFPDKWLDGTWENGVPRVRVMKTKKDREKRVNRLKCIGNSVVPQIPMLIWLFVVKYILGGDHD